MDIIPGLTVKVKLEKNPVGVPDISSSELTKVN